MKKKWLILMILLTSLFCAACANPTESSCEPSFGGSDTTDSGSSSDGSSDSLPDSSIENKTHPITYKAIINGETGWEAVKSVFIGAAIGLMVAGFVVTIMGVFNVVGSGIAFAGKTIGFTAYRAIFEAGIQIVAIGSLAVDIPAVIIGGLTNTEWPLFEL